jgi:hypothetical protein
MRPRYHARPYRRSHPLAGAALAAAVMMTASLTPVAQEGRPLLTLASGRVVVSGTSNIHEYTATTTQVRLTRVQVASAVQGGSLWQDVVRPGVLEAFEISIPAATLTSPKDGLDKNMHKALKVQQHPDITFRLRRLEPGTGATTFKGVGLLRIAGVEREVTLDISTDRTDAGLVVKGSVALLMTDFGIAPPKAMLGMLKTDPRVTVSFETVLAVPLT